MVPDVPWVPKQVSQVPPRVRFSSSGFASEGLNLTARVRWSVVLRCSGGEDSLYAWLVLELGTYYIRYIISK